MCIYTYIYNRLLTNSVSIITYIRINWLSAPHQCPPFSEGALWHCSKSAQTPSSTCYRRSASENKGRTGTSYLQHMKVFTLKIWARVDRGLAHC